MPLISKTLLGNLSSVKSKSFYDAVRELRESASKSVELRETFDIFLSHRYLDVHSILGIKWILEAFGFSVFVDWVENPELDRASVTKETATYLREAMNRSKSLLYAISENSSASRWMPWELGYGDAKHGRVAIIPVTDYVNSSESFEGQEYLSLYPYITLTRDNQEENKLWVNESPLTYVLLNSWLKGINPTYRPMP
jgi:hypothetical protein